MNWIKDTVRSTARAKLVGDIDLNTGKPKTLYRSFTNLLPDADPNDVAAAIDSLMSLQKHMHTDTEQIDYSNIRPE